MFGWQLRPGMHAGAGAAIWTPRSLFSNGEQGWWFDNSDLSTLFQDSAGTTPVTAAGQPVGLQMDKSKGLVLGPELFTNGGFDSGLAGWTNQQSAYSAEAVAARKISGIAGSLQQAAAVQGGMLYEIIIEVASISGGTLVPQLLGGTTVTGAAVTSAGVYKSYITAMAGNTTLQLYGNAPVSAVINSISLRKLPGNHRFQTTAATSRPILRQNATTGAYYLETDGADDWMQTSSIDFTGTDKVTLFAGVRKLSDAGLGTIVELSSNPLTTPGSFMLRTAEGAGPNYSARSGGTIPGGSGAATVAGHAAPTSSVLRMLADIGADSLSLSVNNGAHVSASADQGAGTYGNHPAYFFRRGGASLPFNGHEYGSICVGRLCTAAEIAAVERQLAQRVGAVLA